MRKFYRKSDGYYPTNTRLIQNRSHSHAGRQVNPASLRLFEDLRRLQSSLPVLHHPSLRGDLVSRPIGDVMREAEQLVRSGVKELLVISQDTSAYGVDLKYKTDFWDGRPLKPICKAWPPRLVI